MIREGMTLREATEKWVSEMNAIPEAMIGRLMTVCPDEWEEVTTPAEYDRVCVWDGEHNGEMGMIVEDNIDGEPDLHRIRFDKGSLSDAILPEDEFEVMQDGKLPLWGTMWSFSGIDEFWLEENEENGSIRKMSECGFRIYLHREYGYFFGIDGARYDFYEAHWCPLYKARGLQWHDPATEKEGE